MTCIHCTSELPDADVYCETCGKRLVPEEPPAREHFEVALSAACAGVSDQGLRHERNEDRFAIRRVGDAYALVVCDGVSSSQNPQLASALAAEKTLGELAAGRSMRSSIEAARAAVARLALDAEDDDAPSTTLVAAFVDRECAMIGWVGDSRAYWIAQGQATQLTSDHSWMNEILSFGKVTMEEIENSPNAHAITRWLGGDAEEASQCDVIRMVLNGPGTLLLCTDGLWNYAASPAKIAGLVCEPGNRDALTLSRELVEYPNGGGGRDNTTAVVLQIG